MVAASGLCDVTVPPAMFSVPLFAVVIPTAGPLVVVFVIFA
jgi:hypothetical protein